MNNQGKILTILLIIVVFIVVVIDILRWIQYRILFQPLYDIVWTPTISYYDRFINVDTGEVIEHSHPSKLDSSSNYINIWHFNNFTNRPTILYCHGNYGNISNREYIIDFCKNFHLNLLLFDYQGYGRSTGHPSPSKIFTDGYTAYNYLLQYCRYNNIIIWGESLGGAVAVEIAKKYPCQYLILFSTFSSLDDIIRFRHIKINKQFLGVLKLLFDNMPNKDKIKSIKCNILIVHSSNDDIIPIECARILYNNISHDNKKFLLINGGHTTPDIKVTQVEEIIDYCNFNHHDVDPNFIPHWIKRISKFVHTIT